MKPIGDIIKEMYTIERPEFHVEAKDGDYIGPEGLLHCGVCRECKEHLIAGLGRTVPCLCRCGRMERDAEERRRRDAEKMQRVRELAAYSIMGKKYANARFENAETSEDFARPMRVAQRYVESWNEIASGKTDMTGLLFFGPPGTGKTYLAACIANALMDRMVPVLFTSIIRLANTPMDEMANVMAGVRKAKLLVLDDLGAERETSYMFERVYEVISDRCNAGMPIVVTTNLTKTQISNINKGEDANYQQHNRIFERVKEVCYPVMMNGVKWRMEKAMAARESMRALLEV